MRDEVGSFVALLCGIVLLRLRIGGSYTVYVKPSMGRWLLVAGVLLAVLGTVGLIRWYRGDEAPAPDHAGDHDHRHTPPVALLLVLPVLAVFVVSPTPLGSFAAGRGASGNARLTADTGAGEKAPTGMATAADGPSPYDPPPPPRDGASDISLSDYVPRALYDPVRALGDAPLRLVGFIAPRPGGEGFRLTRFAISCCAADGYAVQVDVVGAPQPVPAKDAWVEVVGRYEPGVDVDVPRLRAERITPIAQPARPYE